MVIGQRTLAQLSGEEKKNNNNQKKNNKVFPSERGKTLINKGNWFFVGKMSLWQILISLRYIWSPCLTPSPFFLFLRFLNFLRNGSSQPNKPYIHFVALQKTHLLSYQPSNYLSRYKNQSRKSANGVHRLRFIHLFKTWVMVRSVWQYMYLVELDETNRMSLISSFYLKPFQSYSQKTIFVNRSKGHNSHIFDRIILKPICFL